jgi:quinol monooxygenase YgiN
MLIVAGTVRVDPAKREEAIRVARAMATATQAEAGCRDYRFWSDLADPALFFIFEVWDSEDALARHFQAEHMRTFQQALPGLGARDFAIQRYAVASVQAM